MLLCSSWRPLEPVSIFIFENCEHVVNWRYQVATASVILQVTVAGGTKPHEYFEPQFCTESDDSESPTTALEKQ